MLGYYKNEEATRQVIDTEGWLHTGDMATIDEDGNVFIKGRCKNLLLTSSGQNILSGRNRVQAKQYAIRVRVTDYSATRQTGGPNLSGFR